MPTIYKFPGSTEADIAQVGGKGLSLIEMTAAELPVPPGFVLSTEFFKSWIDSLRTADVWSIAPENEREKLPAVAEKLQALCLHLQFSAQQEADLARHLEAFSSDAMFAVRSSAPEEDLDSASFAGVYETALGVTRGTMRQKILETFASCVDQRVLVYKREHGFDPRKPEIALIVQQQIDSEISGVAFSVNPLTNSFDEALVSANWGLGETVVQGVVTPDSFVVDRVKQTVIEQIKGSKESSLWLTAYGGTIEKQGYKSDEITMSDERLIELSELVDRVEQFYDKPVDIEWTIANNKLYLLQARAITTYVPLAKELMTRPKEQKKVYLDVTISVQGIYKPLSPMGSSMLLLAFSEIASRAFGKGFPEENTVGIISNGRIYGKLSTIMGLLGKKKLVAAINNLDPIAAQIIDGLNEDEYKERGLGPRQLLLIYPKLLLDRLPRVLQILHDPETARRDIRKRLAAYEVVVQSDKADDSSLETARMLFRELGYHIFDCLVPAVLLSRIAIAVSKHLAPPAMHEQSEILDRALAGNVTVEMGMELSQLSTLVPAGATLDGLADGLVEGTLPAPLLDGIGKFMKRYGHRGPVELDIASARYRDNPRLLLEQMIALSQSKTEDPRIRFEQNKRVREAAHAAILAKLSSESPLKAHLFEKAYQIVDQLGALRETPKFYLIMTLDKIRQCIVQEGDMLYALGRLDAPAQVFDLTIEQLAAGLLNISINLRAQARANRRPLDWLAKVPELPRVIDSRGRIFNARAAAVGEGGYAGMAICNGVARGPVKVLNSPHEKPFNSGDILVARATDPGWTPLFVNAAAVILEVGGPLQHGALVAREYGLPCVAGIPNATKLWPDGTIVEVDGTSGIVRPVDGAEATLG